MERMRVIYRFLFPEWVFQDAHAGSDLERAAAERHNVQFAPTLVRYIERWLLIGLAAFNIGTVCETGLGWKIPAAGLQLLTALACVMVTYLAGARAVLYRRM